jgi:DNA-binding transcriptional MocR family regulator
MSYKLDLSQLQRDGDTSLTQQLVDRFSVAIEAGELEPGEKLPPTRALAAEAGINHLTAARVYRRLAELGYVTATVGRGTFVRSLVPAAGADGDDGWQSLALPDSPISYQSEIISDLFRLAAEPDVISLATGFVSPKTYPLAELSEVSAEVFEQDGEAALGYLTAEGVPALREQIAARGRKLGFASDPEEIIVTSGGQQAIDLVVRAVVGPDDVVALESPTFAGALACLRASGARLVGIPVDAQGMDVDALEQVLARNEVKLCVLQTACHNPTGADLSPERRERLARLAVERNFFILEDGVYSNVRFEGKPVSPLRQAAPGHVLYVNSLSKTVGGGLRIGWVAARGPVLDRVATLKLETDFFTAALTQHIAARWLARGGYERHVEATLPFYRERRDALMEALERHLAGEYRASSPRGGHHLWVTLNRSLDERALYSEAVRHGVAFTPGAAVTVERRSQTSMRLSFSLLDPEELDEGVRRLARAIRELRRRSRLSRAAPVS